MTLDCTLRGLFAKRQSEATFHTTRRTANGASCMGYGHIAKSVHEHAYLPVVVGPPAPLSGAREVIPRPLVASPSACLGPPGPVPFLRRAVTRMSADGETGVSRGARARKQGADRAEYPSSGYYCEAKLVVTWHT